MEETLFVLKNESCILESVQMLKKIKFKSNAAVQKSVGLLKN